MKKFYSHKPSTPRTRAAKRDAIAASIAREPRTLTIPVTPSTVAGVTVTLAIALTGFVEALKL